MTRSAKAIREETGRGWVQERYETEADARQRADELRAEGYEVMETSGTCFRSGPDPVRYTSLLIKKGAVE